MNNKDFTVYPHDKTRIYEWEFPKELKEFKGLSFKGFDAKCSEINEKWITQIEEEEEIEMSESMPSNKKSSKSSK